MLRKTEMKSFLLQSTWESNWGEVTPYNLVTVEQYLTDMTHVMTDKDLKKKVHKFLPFLFQAVDKDNSGEISIDEYKVKKKKQEIPFNLLTSGFLSSCSSSAWD